MKAYQKTRLARPLRLEGRVPPVFLFLSALHNVDLTKQAGGRLPLRIVDIDETRCRMDRWQSICRA